MENINFDQYKAGNLNNEDIKQGFMFEGKFFEIGSLEWNNLMIMEGKTVDKNSLLGIISSLETENVDKLINKN